MRVVIFFTIGNHYIMKFLLGAKRYNIKTIHLINVCRNFLILSKLSKNSMRMTQMVLDLKKDANFIVKFVMIMEFHITWGIGYLHPSMYKLHISNQCGPKP